MAYSLGAIRSLENSVSQGIASYSCASSGAFVPLALMADQPDRVIRVLFEAFAKRRFLNPSRFWRIADFDYLVNDVVGPLLRLDRLDDPSEPEVWVALTRAESAQLEYRRMTSGNALSLLLATNAIPVLYGRCVDIPGEGRFIDGGICDPLPLIHAVSLAQQGSTVYAVATKPLKRLVEGSVGPGERIAILLDPRISRQVKRKLASPNPLVDATVNLATRESVGSVHIRICQPFDSDLSYSRVAVDAPTLTRLGELGAHDMRKLLDCD